MTDYTTNYRLELADFNTSSWHDPVNNNFRILDAALNASLGLTGIAGLWTNSTAYVAGDKLIDADDNTVWRCEVSHTSAAVTTTFEEDRTANPSYWSTIDPGLAIRGEWVTGTAYAIGDVVYSTTEHVVAVAIAAHTATTSIAVDEALGRWDYIANLAADVASATSSASSASASASAASTSASSASTSASNAATSATNSSNSASSSQTSAINAANSATAASTSATNSANSAAASASSATTSLNASTAASSSSSAAGTSATNAANSAATVDSKIAALETMAGFRNKIINGNFDIWQRTTAATTAGFHADRWSDSVNTSTLNVTKQTFTLGQTDVPGNPKHYYRNVVTAGEPAGAYVLITHKIEGVQTLAGKQVTLSFYAKASAIRNLSTEFVRIYGTGGSPSSPDEAIGVVKHSLTTAWQRFNVVTTLPSIAGKTLGSNFDDSLALYIWFDAGSTYNSRTGTLGHQSGTFDIAHISVVEGDATAEDDPFSPRHIQQEETLCHRYYQTVDAAGGGTNTYKYTGSASASYYNSSQGLPVTMRAVPTAVLITAPTYTNASAIVPDPRISSFTTAVTVTAAGAYRAVGAVYSLDAEL